MTSLPFGRQGLSDPQLVHDFVHPPPLFGTSFIHLRPLLKRPLLKYSADISHHNFIALYSQSSSTMRRQKFLTGARDFFAAITPRRRSRSAQPAPRPGEYIHTSASSAVAISHSLPLDPGSGPAPSAPAAVNPQTPAVIVRERYFHCFLLRRSLLG